MQEKFIARCFELAKLGETNAFPNPIVGAVIVHNEKVIGEGFHRICGKEHAEVNAVNSVIAKYPKNHKEILAESEIYVSLEPCSHTGKTPPCTELIKKYRFKKLCFAISDPNPDLDQNRLKAFKAIHNNGTEIVYPEELSLETKNNANFINRIFFHLISLKNKQKNETRNPSWINIKIASYADCNMITKDEDQWITNSESRKDVHRLRSTHDILITGINSIKNDNSKLNIRFSAEELNLADIKTPEIVILKSKQNFTENEKKNLNIFQYHHPQEYKIEDVAKANSLKSVLEELCKNSPQRIMVEAGPKLAESFLKQDLFNEITHYMSLKGCDSLYNVKNIQAHVFFQNNKIIQILDNILKHHQNFSNHKLKIIHKELINSKCGETPDLKIVISKSL